MNILEICVIPALGGLELYFHRCCVELQRRGHNVTSVRLAGSRLETLATRDKIPSHYISPVFSIFPWLSARRLARIMVTEKIDVVHAHHKDNLPLLALTKRLCSRPFQLAFTRQMPMPHKKKDPYHRWLYTSVDLLITITDLLKKDALEKLPLPASRIQRLYYGVNTPPPERDEAFLQTFLNISEQGDFNIGVFSRLEFQKGQHMVVEATRKLIDRKVPAKLYIAGDVMDQDYKQSLFNRVNELGLKDRVAFKGFIQNPVLAMKGMDVLVLPSRNEAFGLVLIEAMRCGVAVMGVNAGGVPEIIDNEKTGLLFKWEDTDQLADELERLYSDPEFRKRLAENGKRKADNEFNAELHFTKLEELFSSLIKAA